MNPLQYYILRKEHQPAGIVHYLREMSDTGPEPLAAKTPKEIPSHHSFTFPSFQWPFAHSHDLHQGKEPLA